MQTPPSNQPGPAFVHAATRDWPAYFAAVRGREPRETLLGALKSFDAERALDAGDWPLAVDIGCGEGRDTAELLRRGWRVLATDAHPDALALTTGRDDLPASQPNRAPLETRLSPMEHLTLPACQLVNASFALPFCPPGAFAELWDRITSAIEPGGRFAGQFFGPDDTWASLPDRSHHSRDEVSAMLTGFDIEHFEEENRPGATHDGQSKHWHVFHVIARKRNDRLPNQ
ncbi:MAG: class I SAM-dependent methyltransferase [Planctomycetota bacterium]